MLMRIICGLATAILLVGCISTPGEKASAPSIAISDVAIFDSRSGNVVQDQTVEIAGGKISRIFPSADGPSSAKRIIDGSGLTLIPGLINAHIHTQSSKNAEAGLSDMLQRGITSVRDLGGDIRPLKLLNRRRVEDGLAIPTIYYSALLAGPKHMSDPRSVEASGGYEPGTAPWMRAVSPTDDLEKIVIEARETGVTGLKIYASVDASLLDRITRIGKQHDLPIWTHSVVFPANADDVVRSAPTQIIHMKGLASADDAALPDNFLFGIRSYMSRLPLDERKPDGQYYRDLFGQMKAHHTILEPALIADGDVAMQKGRKLPPPMLALRDWSCRATSAAFRSGVMIGAGTDYDGEGNLLMMELRRLNECGMPASAVLTAATWNNAEAIGIADRTGFIAVGYDADLVLVKGDPTANLSALEDVQYVLKGGVITKPYHPN